MNNLHYNLIYRAESEGGFTVMVPSLPGCISYGKDLKEAKKMILDAIDGYLVSLKKHGDDFLDDKDCFVGSVEVVNTTEMNLNYVAKA